MNFSSESSEDELSKSYETVISKIISDESPSTEYQLCYVAESGSDSDESCSLFPDLLNVTGKPSLELNIKTILNIKNNQPYYQIESAADIQSSSLRLKK